MNLQIHKKVLQTIFLFFLLFLFQCKSSIQNHKLIEAAGGASCSSFHIENQKGEKVILPTIISNALDCPSMLSLDGDLLIYMIGHNVRLYNLNTQKDEIIISMIALVNGKT